jgi:hypothetical protein
LNPQTKKHYFKMVSKTQTEEYLRKTQLPAATETYTVISHGEVIDTVRKMLEQYGFIITNELYKAEANGNIALGFMQIETLNDPDMAMTFNWTNSYNKQVRFSCSIGGFIYDNQVPFVSTNNQAFWNRKHTGTALEETLETIELMVASAENHFEQITVMKEKFKNLEVNRKIYAKLLGLMYFDKQIISSEQVNIIKREYDKPSFDYKDKGTLWEFYKMVMFGVVDQAPKSWYKQQMDINSYIQVLYNISKIELPNEAETNDLDVEEVQDEEVAETIDLLLAAEPEEEVSTASSKFEIVDLDAEEDAEWDKLEAVGKIAPCVGHETESVIDQIKSVDKLIDAQNLIMDPKPFKKPEPSLFAEIDAKKERLEEIREELDNESVSYGELAELQELAEHIEEGDVQLLEAAGVPEFTEETVDCSDLSGTYTLDEVPALIETIQERIDYAKAPAMSEEQIKMIEEDFGVVDSGSPDDGFIDSTADNTEELFDMMEEYDEVEDEELRWIDSDSEPETVPLETAPNLILDSMREAVEEILAEKYHGERHVVNSIEEKDCVVFELDSEEFFTVDK